MTPLIIAAALSLVALDSTPAASPSATPVAPATVKGAKSVASDNDPDKVICKTEALTGSRFNKRVCMSRSSWDEQAKQTEIFERRMNQTATPMGGGGMSGQ